MSVETGAEEEVLMSRMHLDQLQELRQQSIESKKRLKVVVEFAPFYFSSRAEFGQEDREYAEDGDSYKAKKYVDVLEWMYAPPKSRVSKQSGKPNKLIYVCCCNVTDGDILSYAYSLKQRSYALMERVEFAVRQLKEYLESVENTDDYKYHFNCGSVKLYVSAFYPVDVLLFAFQKALGFSVEKNIKSEGLALQNDDIKEDEVFNKELYGDFIDRVKKNANIQYLARWIKEHHWALHLEDCEVHQVYDMSGTFLTEQGKYKKKEGEITTLMKKLDKPTKDFAKAYKEGKHLFTADDFSLYESYVNSWKSGKNKTIYEERHVEERRPGGEIVDDTYCKMEFPAIEYNGKLYSFYGLRDLLSKEAKEYYAKRDKANDRSELEKQAKAQLEEIDKEEQAFNTRTNKQMAEIEGKKTTLQKRRVQNSPERQAWLNSYADSHASLDDTKDAMNDMEVIEYQGESLNEVQLIKKQIDILNKQMAQSKKFCDRRKKARDLLKQLEKVKWDIMWTAIQVAAAVVCLVLTVVLPPAGVLVATVVCSLTSIGCECMKWATDESASKNWGSHTFSIFLDAVAIAFLPLFAAFSKSAKLIQATHTAGTALETGEAMAKGLKAGEAVGDLAKGAKAGEAVGDVVKGAKTGEVAGEVAKGAKAGEVAGEAGSAAGEAAMKGGNVGKAEGVVDDAAEAGGKSFSNGVDELAGMRVDDAAEAGGKRFSNGVDELAGMRADDAAEAGGKRFSNGVDELAGMRANDAAETGGTRFSNGVDELAGMRANDAAETGGTRFSNGVDELAGMRANDAGKTMADGGKAGEAAEAGGAAGVMELEEAEKVLADGGKAGEAAEAGGAAGVMELEEAEKVLSDGNKAGGEARTVKELERRVFEISPDTYKELGVSKTGKPDSYFARMTRMQKFVHEGKYSSLFADGFAKGVNFTGKDLYTGHIGRLLKMFGFSEAANLLKTAGILGIKLPKGLSYSSRAYILFNIGATERRLNGIANGAYFVFDRDLNSEYAADVDQAALSEAIDRSMSADE